MKVLFPLCLALLVLTGCTSISVQKQPKFDIARLKHVFVEQPFNENHHIDELLAEALRAHGVDATSGPLTMMPENTDAILSYDGRWTWDFKTYLIELNVALRTPHTNKKLAEGRYYQPSARTKPAEVVTRDLIDRLYAK